MYIYIYIYTYIYIYIYIYIHTAGPPSVEIRWDQIIAIILVPEI